MALKREPIKNGYRGVFFLAAQLGVILLYLTPLVAQADPADPSADGPATTTCLDGALLCSIERFQTLISAALAITAAIIAYIAAVRSARLQANAAIVSAQKSADATLKATQASIEDTRTSVEEQRSYEKEEENRRKQEQLSALLNMTLSVVDVCQAQIDFLLDRIETRKEFSEPLQTGPVISSMEGILDQIKLVQSKIDVMDSSQIVSNKIAMLSFAARAELTKINLDLGGSEVLNPQSSPETFDQLSESLRSLKSKLTESRTVIQKNSNG